MAVSPSLMRLRQVRELEEDQSRRALQSAISRLSFLEEVLRQTYVQSRHGRQLVQASAENGELVDRLAGLRETSSALSTRQSILREIETARRQVANLRENYLNARIRRRQMECLIARKSNQDAAVEKRCEQQRADDWHRARGTSQAGPQQDAARGLDEEDQGL